MSSSSVSYEIDFAIFNPDGSILHQVDSHREAAFGFFAGANGKHEMCFYNRVSSSDKVLSFWFRGPDDKVVIQTPEGATGFLD